MKMQSSNLKEYLQEELVLRCKKNPAYSLRSFARHLSISPSFLSKILNGKRRITDKVFDDLTTKLNLDTDIINTLQASDCEQTEYNSISQDHFKVISDWYHFAILELTKVKGFKNSAEWISSRLGIKTNEAKGAINRLIRLKYLRVVDQDLVLTNENNTTIKSEFTNFALKKMQDQLLNKAVNSLWDDDFELRDHTSLTVAVNPQDIKEVKNRLKKVRRDICNFLERDKENKPSEVYNLSLSFFSISKEIK